MWGRAIDLVTDRAAAGHREHRAIGDRVAEGAGDANLVSVGNVDGPVTGAVYRHHADYRVGIDERDGGVHAVEQRRVLRRQVGRKLRRDGILRALIERVDVHVVAGAKGLDGRELIGQDSLG